MAGVIGHRLLRTAIVLLCAMGAALSYAADDQPRKYLRFHFEGADYYGYLIDDTIFELDGDFLDGGAETGRTIPLAGVELLAPVEPSKIFGVALNYRSHGGSASAGPPGLFAKPPSALLAQGGAIVMPADSADLHFEGEMVVVIGKTARNVSVADAPGHVFGVTVGNDVTERSYPFHPFHVLRSKGADTFAPLGPWVVPGLDYDSLALTTRLNGEVVQHDTTGAMIHSVAALVSHISATFTLEPGDLVYTGTPGRTRAMRAGDVVEVWLEGVGTLRNTVAATPRSQ
jgi:2-keto-4-pentenoate hydratase/2-oxohepta-3-ene-1,7-dioic acid hydratase in catechol pathway